MKIFHEAPNSIFNFVQHLTDGDYCLVHLMDENEVYKKIFMEASASGREIILDNSIFELGEAYDEDRYVFWANTLRPTWTIVPDVLNSREGTMDRLAKFFENHPHINHITSPIAVVQGDTENEAIKCFKELQADDRVEKIGISFDSSSHLSNLKNVGKDEKMLMHMRGRIDFLSRVTNFGKDKLNKPMHLLGCSLPQEMKYYTSFPQGMIDSVDTSSPIIHGYFGIKYEAVGLARKHPQKLFELINEDVTIDQRHLMAYNMAMFREFTR